VLKNFVTAVLFLAASTTVLADANEYVNPTLGFRVAKPETWLFASAQQNLDNLKSIRLQDAEMQKTLAKYVSAPLVIMLKYAEPYPDVNPSIKVNLKPLGQLKGRDAKEIAALLLPGLQRAFKDLVVAKSPSDVVVSGFKGAYMRVTYSLEVSGGDSFPTSSELWIIPRGDYFFMIGAGTRADERTGTRQEIQDIVNTVSIDR
jgi:hypothetical protein